MKYIICFLLALLTTLTVNVLIYFIESGRKPSTEEVILTVVIFMLAFLLMEHNK